MNKFELSQQVATVIGWKIKVDKESEGEATVTVYYPSGMVAVSSPHFLHVDDAGEYLDTAWAWYMGKDRVIPDYANCTDYALGLTVPSTTLRLIESFQGWVASYYVTRPEKKRNVRIGGSGDTPAEAICKARLALHERFGW